MSSKSSIYPYDDVKILQGLNTLLRLDGYLLANNLSERSITHKLAEYYQDIFHEWNVDCEYNRNLGGPKEITAEEILKLMANQLESTKYLINLFEHTGDEIYEQMRDLERQLRDPSRIKYNEEYDVVLFLLTLANNKKVLKRIYPDIIIHHRGTSDNNIVIEAKKTINNDRKERGYDLVKLITLVSSPRFNYKHGYFIDLPMKDDFVRFKQFSYPSEFSRRVYKIIPELQI